MDLNEETERATAAITALAEAAEATEIRAQEGEGNPAADNPVVDPDTDDDDQGRAILNCLPHCHWISDGYVYRLTCQKQMALICTILAYIQSGASYLSQGFVMIFHVSCEGLPGQ